MPHPDYLRTRLSTEDVKCLKGLGQKTLHIKFVGDEEGDFIPRPPNICDSGDGSDECHRCVATLFYRLRDEYQESKQKEPR